MDAVKLLRDSKDVLLIQEEANGEFSWYMPEIDRAARGWSTPEQALSKALGFIRKDVSIIKGDLQEIDKQIAILEKRKQELLSSDLRLKATALLDEEERCRKAIHILGIEHPLEDLFGKILCVGFFPYKDMDADGKIDCAKVLYSNRRF